MDTKSMFGRRVYVRERELLEILPISRSTLWRMVHRGAFPEPVRLSPGVTAFRTEDCVKWLSEHSWSSP